MDYENEEKRMLISMTKKISYDVLLEAKKIGFLDVYSDYGHEQPPNTSQNVSIFVEQALTLISLPDVAIQIVIVTLKNLKEKLFELQTDIYDWELVNNTTFEQEYIKTRINAMKRSPSEVSDPKYNNQFEDDHSYLMGINKGGRRTKRTRRRKNPKKKSRRVRRNVNKK